MKFLYFSNPYIKENSVALSALPRSLFFSKEITIITHCFTMSDAEYYLRGLASESSLISTIHILLLVRGIYQPFQAV
jgi:hypothetical protein